jgi:hypothetical protein
MLHDVLNSGKLAWQSLHVVIDAWERGVYKHADRASWFHTGAEGEDIVCKAVGAAVCAAVVVFGHAHLFSIVQLLPKLGCMGHG